MQGEPRPRAACFRVARWRAARSTPLPNAIHPRDCLQQSTERNRQQRDAIPAWRRCILWLALRLLYRQAAANEPQTGSLTTEDLYMNILPRFFSVTLALLVGSGGAYANGYDETIERFKHAGESAVF